MNIQKQKRLLYLLELTSNFSLTGGAWIIFLAQRGFSLFEIAVGETFFHIVSFLAEIPSGAAADLWGRKKTMLISQLCFILSVPCYIFAYDLPLLMLAMGLTALGYNFNSGTRSALTYDSLLQCGKEEEYLKVSADQRFLYSFSSMLASLCTGIVGKIGYVLGNLGDLCFNLTSAAIIGGLTEPTVTENQKNRQKFSLRTMGSQIWQQFSVSFAFLKGNPTIAVRMFLDACIGCCDTLTVFFLQQHFSESGASFALIGILLVIVQIGGMAGTRVAPLLGKRLRFGKMMILCSAGAVFALVTAGSTLPILSAAGGFFLRGFGLLSETVTSDSINRDLPSDQRATLISVGSIMFSTAMIGATPLLGALSDSVGTARAFPVLGLVLACIAAAILLLGKKAFFAEK